jgi:hypothetical protein
MTVGRETGDEICPDETGRPGQADSHCDARDPYGARRRSM